MGLRSFLYSFGRSSPVSVSMQEQKFAFPESMYRAKDRSAKAQKSPPIHARYDAAQTTDEFKNYWANADAFDADSANSPEVRHALINRSRYELANNGYADGIGQTYSTDVVFRGPTLQMQTGSKGFNRMVELQWYLWSKAIGWRRKLWCMTHAKHGDGEGFGVIRMNKRLKHPVPLDVVLYEAEQFQTPYLEYGAEGYIDGIRFDQFGNPLWYDLLKYHPGNSYLTDFQLVPEQIPAEFVLHWFKLRRPGQHRGVPECSSTLQVGASSRRMREATVSSVENAARLGAIILESTLPPDEQELPEPMSTTDTKVGMMTTMPTGWHASQMEAKHPNATYQEFLRSQISEMARPKSMPANKARCDSSDYNFASGRLDHISYYDFLDVDREDCNDLVLDRLFDVWFDMAVLKLGWLGGNPDAIGPAARMHVWDWPTHKVADEKSQALADAQKLATGQILLPQLYAQRGLDFEDEVERAAPLLGLSVEELRKRMLDASMPVKSEPAAPNAALEQAIDEEEREEQERQEQRRAAAINPHNRLNGHLNGVAH